MLALVQQLGEAPQVVGLGPEVEFCDEARTERVEEVDEGESAADLRGRVDHAGQVGEDLEVSTHRVGDARTLHLHHDLAPVGERRSVDLGDRCRSDRFVVEPCEHVADLDAELSFDDRADLGGRDRVDVVLESLQRVEVCLREQVGPGGEHLPELDEGRAHRLEVTGERLRGLVVGIGRLGRLQVLQLGLEPRLVDQVGTGVADQQPQDVGVSCEAIGAQRGEDAHPRSFPKSRSEQSS